MPEYKQYTYQPLSERDDQVRVLALYGAASRDDDLRMELLSIPLLDADNVKFEAISYAWGSREALATVYVKKEGRQKWRTLSVTRNCAEALRYLRRTPPNVRLLWCDAICINQEDVREKSIQVGIMSSIYARASHLNVWLGLRTEQTDFAIAWMAEVNRNIAEHPGTKELYPLTDRPEWYENAVLISKAALDGLAEFMLRPWFERLWVWQEVLHAKHATILCGDSWMPWRAFVLVLRYIAGRCFPVDCPEQLPERIRLVSNIVRVKKWDFLQALDSLRACKCYDDRDRIYTAQAFVGEKVELRIVPDYTKPVAELYTEAILRWLAKVRNLDFLRYKEPTLFSGTESRLNLDLPSWIPDWSKPSGLILVGGFTNAHSKASVVLADHRCLRVKGLIADVVELTKPFGISIQSHWVMHTIRDCLQHIIKDLYPQGLDRNKARRLCMALRAGHFAHLVLPTDPSLIPIDNCIDLLMYLANGENRRMTEDDMLGSTSMFTLPIGRSIIRTRKGWLGLAPVDTQPGDLVTVLLGCTAAIILRPSGRDANEYNVIGSAYCEDIDCGEAILGPLPDNVEPLMATPSGKHEDTFMPAFKNRDENMVHFRDPRLPPLSPDWRSAITKEGRLLLAHISGEDTRFTSQDPRCDADALVSRGVKLREFALV